MLTEALVGLFTQIMLALGYIGVAVLMVFESMILPVPSEAVMPFAGFLVAQGKFNFWIVVIVSAIGSIIGSLLSYWIGMYGGRPIVKRYGKFLLLHEGHLEWTEKWFKKYGDEAVFISRFIPVVRHLISIPAGIAEMNMKKFLFYTFTGAFIWNGFLTWVGMKMGENWEQITGWFRWFDIVIIAVLAALLIYYVWKNRHYAVRVYHFVRGKR